MAEGTDFTDVNRRRWLPINGQPCAEDLATGGTFSDRVCSIAVWSQYSHVATRQVNWNCKLNSNRIGLP